MEDNYTTLSFYALLYVRNRVTGYILSSLHSSHVNNSYMLHFFTWVDTLGVFWVFFFSCAHWFSTGRSLSRSILFFNLNHLKKKQSHLGSSHFLFRHIPAPLIILVFKLFLFDVKKSKKSCALLWAHKTFTLWIFNVFEDDSNIRCMLISPESNNELFLHISYILL